MGAGKTTVLPEASDILALRHIARAAKLNTILDRARLEDFTVTNENRSVTVVAQKTLVKARWIAV